PSPGHRRSRPQACRRATLPFARPDSTRSDGPSLVARLTISLPMVPRRMDLHRDSRAWDSTYNSCWGHREKLILLAPLCRQGRWRDVMPWDTSYAISLAMGTRGWHSSHREHSSITLGATF